MQEFRQQPGVRPWHGEELLSLQAESLDVLQALASTAGSCIITGCAASSVGGNNIIAAGIVGIQHADGFKVARFAGATGVTFPAYLVIVKSAVNKVYADNNNKLAAEVYTAQYTGILPPSGTPYLAITLDGAAPSFIQGIVSAGWTTLPTYSSSTSQVSCQLNFRTNKLLRMVQLTGTVTINSSVQDPPVFYNLYTGMPTNLSPAKSHYFHGYVRVNGAYVSAWSQSQQLIQQVTMEVASSALRVQALKPGSGSYDVQISTTYFLD